MMWMQKFRAIHKIGLPFYPPNMICIVIGVMRCSTSNALIIGERKNYFARIVLLNSLLMQKISFATQAQIIVLSFLIAAIGRQSFTLKQIVIISSA